MSISWRLSLSKNLYHYQNGVWGVAPSGVRAAAPIKFPFPGERGLGIGIENPHYLIKTDFFYNLSHYDYIIAAFVQLVHLLSVFWCIPPNTPLYFLTYYSIYDKIRLSKCKFKRCFL